MRERRAAHVRPLPPAGERIRERRISRRSPSLDLGRRYGRSRDGEGGTISLPLAAIIVVVGVATLVVGGNLLVGALEHVAGAFDDAVSRITSAAPATPAPSGVALDTPVLDTPDNGGFTNQAVVALSGSVPGAVVGKNGYMVRIYVLDERGSRNQVAEMPVGQTTKFSSGAIHLAEGRNTFAATLVTPIGEGQPSPIVTYTLDTQPPRLTVVSPANNSFVRTASVSVTGRTDPGATVTVRNRNAPGGSLATKTAGDDGRFAVSVALVAGSNTIDLTATDRAGNSSSLGLAIKRDYGKLAAHFSASPVKFASSSTTTLKLSVHATAEDGSPLARASVTFTVTVQGLGPIVSPELLTDGFGVAAWQTAISGASPGIGAASVLIVSDDGDQVTATIRLTTV